MSKPTETTWAGVFKRTISADNVYELVALFRDPQDAKEWHENPAVYSIARRRVKIQPPPIEVKTETEALALLDAIVNGSDAELFDAIEPARALIKRQRSKTK